MTPALHQFFSDTHIQVQLQNTTRACTLTARGMQGWVTIWSRKFAK